MCTVLTKDEIEEIVEVLKSRFETDISAYSETFLCKSIEKRIAQTSVKTADDYLGLLLQNTGEKEELTDSLNINYSLFFRSLPVFALLENYILPSLISKKEKTCNPKIRIWSAGCASGEEAYSMAILLDELNFTGNCPIPFRIFATDISQDTLNLAKKGIYRSESLSNVRQKHISSYFISKGETYYEVIPRLRENIDFSIYDLLEKQSACPPPSIYGEFDIVLCSNLLFYYKPEICEFVLEKLASCLVDGGYMITGEAERSIVEKTKTLQPALFPITVFKKFRAGR